MVSLLWGTRHLHILIISDRLAGVSTPHDRFIKTALVTASTPAHPSTSTLSPSLIKNTSPPPRHILIASADRHGHRIDRLVVTNHFPSPYDIIDWGERRYLSDADGLPLLIRLVGSITPSSADRHGHRIDSLVVTNHLMIPYDTINWRARRYLSYADGIPQDYVD